MSFTIVSQGTFTQPSTAVGQTIPLPSGADYFVSTNLTQMATTANPGVCVRGEWYGGGLTALNDGLRWKKPIVLAPSILISFLLPLLLMVTLMCLHHLNQRLLLQAQPLQMPTLLLLL